MADAEIVSFGIHLFPLHYNQVSQVIYYNQVNQLPKRLPAGNKPAVLQVQ